MMNQSPQPPRRSVFGFILTVLLVVGLAVLGAWLYFGGGGEEQAAGLGPARPPGTEAPAPAEPVAGTPLLDRAAPYVAKDGVIEVDISEYAGYGGLIVANGGMEPNPDSFFARQYGFRLKLSRSEGERWSQVNSGQLAAGATTADALAVLGRQFEVVVPALIGFSRGADMVVVDAGIGSINQLAGKVLAGSQFNESEFFLRYLAQEAGLPVKLLRDLEARPGAGEIGLVAYDDAFAACDAYAHELARKSPRLNGCVGWTPKTEEVIEGAGGRAKLLVSNRNLIIVADILTVNKGFAAAEPRMVKGLVHGLLEGNRLLREDPERHLPLVAQAFGWAVADARDELARVHLANLPENAAFFAGTIDSAGSFSGIYQSAVLAYGSIVRNPPDAERFVDLSHLEALTQAGLFAGQTVAIAPIRTAARQPLEGDPLLSKDIRFFFEPNSAVLEGGSRENQQFLDSVKAFLQVSPGSVVVLRGHVDNARIAEFRKQGGETLVRSMSLKAMELSKDRAEAVRKALLLRHKGLDGKRLEVVGRGWEEPVSPDSALNRRVEVQWFTLE